MINGNPNDFLEHIYSCQNTIFIYNGIKYWFQGYMPTESSVYMEIFQYQPPSENYFWSYEGKTLEECYHAFLDAPIFNGKTFWSVEDQLEWVDD